METRVPSWQKLLTPAGFVLLCVVLSLLAFRSFGGALPLQPQGYRFDVPLEDASNLVSGSDVQISGVDIGRVVKVRRDRSGALATLEIEAKYAPLGSAARVIPRLKTLLGEAYLEVAPGPADVERIPDGGRLAADQVDPSVKLDEFLETFTSETRRDVRRLFTGLSRALDGRAEALSHSLGRMAPFSRDLGSLLDTLEDQESELGGLISGSADLLAALGEREGSLQRAIEAGSEVVEVTGQKDRELAATVRELAPFLSQLRQTSSSIDEASGELNGAVVSLGEAAPHLRPALRAAFAAAPEFTGLFQELPSTMAAGNRGLSALARMVPPTRQGLGRFYPASRELLPLVQLLAASNKAPTAPLANVGNFNNGTWVGPGGLVQHYGKGIVSVWNESVGGWKKRLPSQVMNPYPAPPPAGLGDLERLGYVKAYDCRNTDNPNFLPPTGTGTPECVLQGPWDFKGQSAFYPRLRRAAP